MPASAPLPAEASRLQWDEKNGIGRYPVDLSKSPYGADYWGKYLAYSGTQMGQVLTKARIDLVHKYAVAGRVVDIGVGCGQFLEACANAGIPSGGYDVNETAVRWLLDKGLWWDPWFREAEHATCWDSLEHMERPGLFVTRVRTTLFVSIPIFHGREHILQSRHFRPDEHVWYFTEEGLLGWMSARGFACLEKNSMESELGREDIGTFVFRRRSW